MVRVKLRPMNLVIQPIRNVQWHKILRIYLPLLLYKRANVLGHDRGARVAYRFALDHPERINKLGIIEIVPTADFWASWTADLAIAAYHWTFLAQPAPIPERMIGADPVAYLDWTLAQWTLEQKLRNFFTGCFSELPQAGSKPCSGSRYVFRLPGWGEF